VVEPLQKIVDHLAPTASLEGLEFKVHVVRSPQINAFCLPGGTIVVFTGLIDAAERPEQLAGVLGHEMAHATLRHGMERTAQALGVGAALAVLVGDGTGLLAIGAEVFQFATVNSYSRVQENEADAEGLRMLHESGIDPTAMAEFFEIMQHEHPDMPGALNWVSTHPSHEERIRLLQQQVGDLPEADYQPLDTDLEKLKQAIK
jgi:predicted Zn-dependent protease